jgi:hypothetical protein
MVRTTRLVSIVLLFLLMSTAISAQTAAELYWGLTVLPPFNTGYPNMVWFDTDGVPGPDPIAASPAIPLPAGEWTPESGPRWMDAVQVPHQSAIFMMVTAGYGAQLRAYRVSGSVFAPCGSYPLSYSNGEAGSVRVAYSGSYAVVVYGSSPSSGAGGNMLLKFPMNLTTPIKPNGPCLLSGGPASFPVNDSAIRNIDFNPTNPQEAVISGYSNVVTFMNPMNGTPVCQVALPSNDTRVEALYRPDGGEVWASSYDGQQIAIIQPPPVCSASQYIGGFGPLDNLGGSSFHPDPSAGAYYTTSYPQGNLYAIDTTTKLVTATFHVQGAMGMTATTRGTGGRYLLEIPIYGCCPQFGRTDTYDVTSATDAKYLTDFLGSHNSTVGMRRVAVLRNVSP